MNIGFSGYFSHYSISLYCSLQEDFALELEKELDQLRRSLDRESDLSQSEMEENYKDQISNLQSEFKGDIFHLA